MNLDHTAYNVALDVFEQAVAKFAAGDGETGEQLLAALETDAIERDRGQLLALARTARLSPAAPTTERALKTLSRDLKEQVQRRDGFRCRFTGRRLVDTRVFREVSRLSSSFHFDEHHSVYHTKRGPGGHPLVRTHGAAYEHAQPLSRGGQSTIDNILLTSVQLNESKGARILDPIEVETDSWAGLTQYLRRLREQRSVDTGLNSGRARETPSPRGSSKRRRANRNISGVARFREAADGLPVTVFALHEGEGAEAAFLSLRLANRNAYFANEREVGVWMIHRMHCSSLAFDVEVKLTAAPKAASDRKEGLEEWVRRLGAAHTVCSRCRKAV